MVGEGGGKVGEAEERRKEGGGGREEDREVEQGSRRERGWETCGTYFTPFFLLRKYVHTLNLNSPSLPPPPSLSLPSVTEHSLVPSRDECVPCLLRDILILESLFFSALLAPYYTVREGKHIFDLSLCCWLVRPLVHLVVANPIWY